MAVANGASHALGGEKLAGGEGQTQGKVPVFTRVFHDQFLLGEESHPRFEIEPNGGEPGEKIRVVFTGRGTGWFPRGTRVGFGDGVTVHTLDVLSPEEMLATITIDPDVETGMRTVTVSTPRRHGTLALDDGFSIGSGESRGPVRWPIDGLRLDRNGHVFRAVSRGRVLPIDRSAADTIIGLRRSGAAVTARTDSHGNVTGFDVD